MLKLPRRGSNFTRKLIKGGVYDGKKVIIVKKGFTCVDCYYCRLNSGCTKKNCKLKIDEIYKEIEEKNLQLKLF